jgi:hypothetical protein
MKDVTLMPQPAFATVGPALRSWLATLATALTLIAPQAVSAAEGQDCLIGPVTKQYGAANWLVYSCADGETLAFISAPDNPATPFYFLLVNVAGQLQLSGEGSGQRDAAQAAFDDLSLITEIDRAALLTETKAVTDPARP